MISKATIKYIQSLQDKKERDAAGSFVAEGIVLIQELLQERIFKPEIIVAGKETITALNIEFGSDTITTVIAEEHELKKISSRSSPSRVVAVFKKKVEVLPASLQGKISLALFDLQDPGNLGTIIRTADWFGIENIFCSRHTTDVYNPKVVQSTMASLGRVGIHYVDMETWLSSVHIPKYATTLQGKILQHGESISEGIIIVGNEGQGIPPGIIKMTDHQITIAKKGQAESLNAAVATGIILSMITVT